MILEMCVFCHNLKLNYAMWAERSKITSFSPSPNAGGGWFVSKQSPALIILYVKEAQKFQPILKALNLSSANFTRDRNPSNANPPRKGRNTMFYASSFKAFFFFLGVFKRALISAIQTTSWNVFPPAIATFKRFISQHKSRKWKTSD